jgi:CheY-like chemotaxis protein
MSSVLLIENESYWLELIRRALPEYDVTRAQSYDEAMALLAGGVTYDVAIVDLNLLETGNDRLGEKLLEIMRHGCPSTRRIALTGSPPTAVRSLFEQYDIDDLLLKENMVLQVVREVVETASRRVADDVPAHVTIEQAEIRNTVLSLKSDTLPALDQRIRTLRNDVREARRVGKRAGDSERELAAVEARKQDLETRCSELMTLVAHVRNDEELAYARRGFDNLKTMFGS